MTPAPDAPIRRRCGDTGSAVAEVAVIAPVLLVVLGFVVFAGRVGSLDQKVHTVAGDSARAASITSPTRAAEQARSVAERSLADHQVACRNLTVDVDSTRLQAGGSVAVVVRCEVSLEHLAGFPLPGGRTMSARAVQVVDRFRSEASP